MVSKRDYILYPYFPKRYDCMRVLKNSNQTTVVAIGCREISRWETELEPGSPRLQDTVYLRLRLRVTGLPSRAGAGACNFFATAGLRFFAPIIVKKKNIGGRTGISVSKFQCGWWHV